MNMKISLYIFAVFISILTQSCCNYLPFVDYQTISDYKEKVYKIDAYSYLIKSDSLQVKVNASALIPSRCRSKKSKTFFVEIGFKIEKNLYTDSVIVRLDINTQLSCSDGVYNIIGKSFSNGSRESVLVIKMDKYYINGDDGRIFRLGYKFDFNNIKEFNYSKHNLKVDFGKLIIDNSNVTTKNILGSLE